MNFRHIWRRITKARRTREREATAQYERVQREGALRDDFARRTQALESQLAQAHAENCRLRAENRALLNSVLGIAGIPPVIVADPSLTAGEPGSAATADLPFAGARDGSAALTASGLPGGDTCLDAAHTATPQIPESRHPEERSDEGPLFVSPGCLGPQSKRDPSGKNSPQDDGAVEGSASENSARSSSANPGPYGSASPSAIGGRSSAVPLQKQSPLASTPLGENAASPQKQLRGMRCASRKRPARDRASPAPALAPDLSHARI